MHPETGPDFSLPWSEVLERNVKGDFADFDAVRVGNRLGIDFPDEPGPDR